MISCPFERDSGQPKSSQPIGELTASWIGDRQMIKPRRSRRRSFAPESLPSVQSNMMVVTTRREKYRASPIALRNLEAQHIAVKAQGTLEVRNLQMHMPDA